MRLDDFYADPRRRGSAEVGLAREWSSQSDRGASFSLSWVAETGEVYALRHGPVAFGPGAPKPYGVYFPAVRGSVDPDREVIVLAAGVALDVATAAVAEADATQRTLEWVRGELGHGETPRHR